jgi:hypothetical protein
VSRVFAELDRRMTPMGEISLRRRLHPALHVDIYEVKLGDEHLMSSLFTTAEEELARLGLAAVRTGSPGAGTTDGGALDVGSPGAGSPHAGTSGAVAVDAESVDDGPPDSEPLDGRPPDGEPIDGGSPDGEPLDGGPPDGEPLDGGSPDGEPLDGEPIDGGPPGGEPLDVVVGGLGLGYTARAVLEDPRVGSLRVIEALGAVVDWHEQGLVPLGDELTADPRCHLVEGDFFALVAGDRLGEPGSRSHAVLVDIDHTPRHVLDPTHARFYTPEGLRDVADRLHPGGVFGLWSDDPPDDRFVASLDEVFATSEAHVVTFPNPLTDGTASNTVYVATTAG